jgi:hypothetical protein
LSYCFFCGFHFKYWFLCFFWFLIFYVFHFKYWFLLSFFFCRFWFFVVFVGFWPGFCKFLFDSWFFAVFCPLLNYHSLCFMQIKLKSWSQNYLLLKIF